MNQALQNWLAQCLQSDQIELQPLSGDASFRRYFRLHHQGRSLIAVNAPPATEKNPQFVAIARALSAAGVVVPEVLDYDYQQGFMLLSDLGDTLLLPLLTADSVDHWYHSAMQMLARMQAMPVQADEQQTALLASGALTLPRYTRQRLWDEMALCPQWFVTQLLGHALGAAEQSLFDSVFGLLCDSALRQPQVFVHRDYHARNIMCLDDGRLATIDFQDAVIGPITYDLVSLLRDCYIVWPEARVQDWLQHYRNDIAQHPELQGLDDAGWLRCFDLMGLQRHIKVLGIFARLSLRDGKDGYLQDLPTVLNYVLRYLAGYPECRELYEFFVAVLLPKVQQQAWGQHCVQPAEQSGGWVNAS